MSEAEGTADAQLRTGTGKGYVFFTETTTRGSAATGGDCIDGTITVTPAGKRRTSGWVGTCSGQAYVSQSTIDLAAMPQRGL